MTTARNIATNVFFMDLSSCNVLTKRAPRRAHTQSRKRETASGLIACSRPCCIAPVRFSLSYHRPRGASMAFLLNQCDNMRFIPFPMPGAATVSTLHLAESAYFFRSFAVFCIFTSDMILFFASARRVLAVKWAWNGGRAPLCCINILILRINMGREHAVRVPLRSFPAQAAGSACASSPLASSALRWASMSALNSSRALSKAMA